MCSSDLDRARGCLPGTPPSPVDDGDPCTVDGPCDESLRGFPRRRDDTSPVCVPLAPVPRQGARDYAFWYWPGNHRPNETWPTVSRVMHFLTGFYGMSFDEERGDLVTLGRMATAPSAEDALRRPVADVDRLPGATVLFEAGSGDVRTRADRFQIGRAHV